MATTLLFPGILVVLSVCHHLEDEHLLAGIEDTGHQPIFVSADVENDAVAYGTRSAKLGFHVSPGLPCHGPVTHMGVPCTERPFGVPMAGHFPELFQPGFRDHSHPFLLHVSATIAIIIRKTRTGKARVRRTQNLWKIVPAKVVLLSPDESEGHAS